MQKHIKLVLVLINIIVLFSCKTLEKKIQRTELGKTIHLFLNVLKNIKLRLNEIGGSIKYVSEKGEGTEVEISISV